MARRTAPLKYGGPGEETRIVKRWGGGFTWMAHPDERMRRASHALVVDHEVWLVDPLDTEGLDAGLAGLGTVSGVVVLTNSHGRDADRLAERHDVPIHVPVCFDLPEIDFDAPVETFEDELADTGFELVWEKDSAGWKEGSLYHPERRTLVVADALGTAPIFSTPGGRLELFPLFQFSPPENEFGGLPVERILVGHGDPIFEDPESALEEALDVTGLGATAGFVCAIPTFARVAISEIRG